MTHEIVAADRADAAVKISMEGMTAGYMVELTQITNEMLAAGYYSDANEIAKVQFSAGPLCHAVAGLTHARTSPHRERCYMPQHHYGCTDRLCCVPCNTARGRFVVCYLVMAPYGFRHHV